MNPSMRFASFGRIAFLASLSLLVTDAGVVYATRRGTALTPNEWAYALLGSWACVWALALVGLLFVYLLAQRVGLAEASDFDERALATRRASLFAGVLSTFAYAWLGWTLTAGRQAQHIPGRVFWIIGGTALLGVGTMFAIRAYAALRVRGSLGLRVLFLMSAAALVVASAWINATVLPRGYPAFHTALGVFTIVCAVAFADSCIGVREFAPNPVWSFLVFALSASSAVVIATVCKTPTIHFFLSEKAPLSGMLVRTLPVRRPRPVAPRPVLTTPINSTVAANQQGLDLRGQSVLLITVDALRADTVRASGGHGLTPHIDELAEEGAVFTHAYTSTPHTSYAVTSILTGAFMRPVMELSSRARPHETIADILARHSVKTAAFYPPAVFFVDEDRFASYRTNAFGFRAHRELFANGPTRVTELREYMLSVHSNESVFVWVHLFEPHEPYEPPPELVQGDSDRALYDGEVRAADASIGELVAAFRESRPSSTVIVTADHGEEFGEHGGQFHGTTLYEEQVRVPLVWSSPGFVSPHIVSQPVENVDIVPTLLAALGIPSDPRMTGDDLTALLQASPPPTVHHAFASIHDEWMVSDGIWKAICDQREGGCRLYDLAHDSGEAREVSVEHPTELATLRGVLSEMIASIPRIESAGSEAWPVALSQAELGDLNAAPALVTLLGSENMEVRRAAARFLGELRYAPASTVLLRMSVEEQDPVTKEECALAALRLGERAPVQGLHSAMALPPSDSDAATANRRRRVALALAEIGDGVGEATLLALAQDVGEEAEFRAAAIRSLGRLRARSSRAVLSALLADLTLRTAAADALGELGDRRAIPALRIALASERYPAARIAEERAIARLSLRR